MVRVTLHGRPWFAWHPVRLGLMNNGPIVWFEWLMRYRAGDMWFLSEDGLR